MSSLKQKTEVGIRWSIIESIANMGSSFIIGLILARLLTPREFGLIGMITIFFAISQSFINSGFSTALIRKPDCTKEDYSTVFYFNLGASIIFFIILYFSANSISRFFAEPQLIWLIRILGLDLIIRSFSIIQSAILTKRVDFKLQTIISIISNVLSGSLGIYLAFNGYGVWSLVAYTLSQGFISSVLLWLFNKWRPSLLFSKKSFNELFGFGSKLMFSSLINTIYMNIYFLVIGKYYSAQDLGYFTRAKNFSDLPSLKIYQVMSRVTFPVLSQMQHDKIKLKAAYKLMLKNIMFIMFIIMIGIAATSESLILLLIGEKWRQSIPYLQLLSFVGMIYPLQSLNMNILNVLGRSDIYLKLEVIKKLFAIPIIIIGIFIGIKAMIIGLCVIAIIDYFLNSYYSGRMINYKMKEQIFDLLPAFFIAFTMGVAVFVTGELLHTGNLLKLCIQSLLGICIVIILGEKTKLYAYSYIKRLFISKIKGLVAII